MIPSVPSGFGPPKQLVPMDQGIAFRVKQGDYLLVVVNALVANTVTGTARLLYDDGTYDQLLFPPTSTPIGQTVIVSNRTCGANGWVIGLNVYAGTTTSPGATFCQVFIASSGAGQAGANYECISQNYISAYESILLGQNEPVDFKATWVFQGTVAEDATVGTHVCTLTVTPGAGNELMLIGGEIKAGATATAQSIRAYTTDGTNDIDDLIDQLSPGLTGGTTSGAVYPLRLSGTTTAYSGVTALSQAMPTTYVSGTMQLVLKVSTTAVSVTQTFSIACRLKGISLPTATLADSVGAPALTTNTNKVF